MDPFQEKSTSDSKYNSSDIGRLPDYSAFIDQPISWITDQIAIGSITEAESVEILRVNGFGSALALNTLAKAPPPAIEQLKLPFHSQYLKDGSGNSDRTLRTAVNLLAELAAQHPPVLVYCTAGINRSPVIVAGYIALKNNLSFSAALKIVATKREVSIDRSLLDEVQKALSLSWK